MARLVGNLMSGVVRDSATLVTNSSVAGYNIVFVLEIIMLISSLIILRSIDVSIFKEKATSQLPYLEKVALANEG